MRNPRSAQQPQADSVTPQPPSEYYLPDVDIMETPNELIIIADMPGVTSEALEVTVNESILTVAGRVPMRVDAGEKTRHNEFARGDYYRQFRVPREFATGKIHAALNAGVVTIRIPRDERTQPRRIEIRSQ